MSDSVRPNILFVLFDSLQAQVLGCFGNRGIITPAFDRLAEQGERMTRGYCTAPICLPSRRSIFTGLMPSQHGVRTNADVVAPQASCEHQPTVPSVLRGAGYRCGYVGQIHDRDVVAQFHDRSDAVSRWWRHRESVGGDIIDLAELYEQPGARYCGSFKGDEQYLPDYWYTRGAVEMIHQYRNAGAPWYIHCDFAGPHMPLVLPEQFVFYGADDVGLPANFGDSLEGKMVYHAIHRARLKPEGWTDWHYRNFIAYYWSYVQALDNYLGRVLDALDTTGQADKTIVVVTSDHGELIGAHGLIVKYGAFWEEVARIPVLVRWIDRVAPGSTRDELVTHLDWLPTLAAAAGVPLSKGTPGVDLFDRRRDQRWAVVSEYAGANGDLCSMRMLRTRQHKYIFNAADREELYDTANDPAELRNIASEPNSRSVLDECRRGLYEQMKATGDPLVAESGRLIKLHPLTARPTSGEAGE